MKETIKQLEQMLKVRKEQKEIIECAGGTCVNCNPDIQALQFAIDGLKRVKKLEKENIRLRYQDIPYLEGQIKGYKVRIEELKANQCDHNISNECIRKSIIRDKITERQFELQQEYEDFENDIRLNTLIEILGEE